MERGEIIIYQSEKGKPTIDIRLLNDNIWLNQKQIAELFDTQRPAITKHLASIFKAGELREDSVSSILEHTATDSKNYDGISLNEVVFKDGISPNTKLSCVFTVYPISDGKYSIEVIKFCSVSPL